MMILPNFIKTFRENLREWKILILVVVFAPFFVLLMHLYFGSTGSYTYTVAVLNRDGEGSVSAGLVEAWGQIRSEEGKDALNLRPVATTDEGGQMLREAKADLFVTIPAGFSDAFLEYAGTGKGSAPELVSAGDMANVRTVMAASLLDYTSFTHLGGKAGIQMPFSIRYETGGIRKAKSEFDLYVPALLVMAVIMMLFTAGASIVREVEKETILRLSLSRLSSGQFMAAQVLNQVLIGLLSLSLTWAAARSVGYRSDGSMLLLLAVGILACLSVAALGVITACFVRTMFGLLTVGCFPFFIMMFFSDCFVPLPRMTLFRLAGNTVFLNDLLPTATATRAMNKILNFNAGFTEIRFELAWMTVLSILYFMIGIRLFRKTYRY
jgi:ABC-2 type transport system permease protein